MAIALGAHITRVTAGTSAPIDTTGATLLIVAVANTVTQSVVSDNKGNLWNVIAVSGVQNQAITVLFAAFNPTVGTGHTFTLGAPASAGGCIAAFTGTALSFPTSRNTFSSAANVASLLVPSLTPEVGSCLRLTAIGYRTTGVLSIDSGFTIIDQLPFAAGSVVGCGLAYLIDGSTPTAKAPTWSWTGGNSNMVDAVQSYAQPPVVVAASGGAYAFA